MPQLEDDFQTRTLAGIGCDRRAGTPFRRVPAGDAEPPADRGASAGLLSEAAFTCGDEVSEKTLSTPWGLAYRSIHAEHMFGAGGPVRLVAYLRVSTDRQAERGLGLAVQEAAVRRWARREGHRIVGWHRDAGVSGSNGLESRAGLPEAFASLRRCEAAGLVVYRLDRLARDLVLQETLLAELRRLGARAFSTDGGEAGYLDDDPDEPSRRLIRQVLGAVAEYERSIIALRMRAGRQQKARRGGYASGAPPYGWRAEDGSLVADDSEQRVVGLMRELEAEGIPQRTIADRLNAAGHRTKQGRPWNRVSVGVILRRPARGSENVSAEPGSGRPRARTAEENREFLDAGGTDG